MGGVWGRTDQGACAAEPRHCPPEVTTTLSTGYTPIQNEVYGLKNKLKEAGSERQLKPPSRLAAAAAAGQSEGERA